MSISFYILFISNLVFLILNHFFPFFISDYQIYISIFLIALIGIPHGAIDHLLYLKKTNKNKSYFYTFYLTLLSICVILWIYLPLLSLSLFLIISAYHFGQSQFEKYKTTFLIKKLIGFFWGALVLSGLVIFNFKEILILLSEYNDFNVFDSLFNLMLFKSIFYGSIVLFLGFGLISFGIKLVAKELIYLSLIIGTFMLQPLLLGFALFFIFNHSFTVMRTEYKFLSKYDTNFNLSKFIKALTPFTFLSIVGTLFLYYFSTIGWIDFSLPFILLITISSLTFPHVEVMEVFYTKK